ncbi:hypothetical protein BDF21DRAFT_404072 [Thamnidium elegans]|nr:hypothetical protein BDF21DRAFT_404072 [Thamnidium elegans]
MNLIYKKSTGSRNQDPQAIKVTRSNLSVTIMILFICYRIFLHTYTSNTYMNNPDESSTSQLWEPFISSCLNSLDSIIEGVPVKSIVKSLKKYYSRVTSMPFGRIVLTNLDITLAARCWIDNRIYSSLFDRRKKKRKSQRKPFCNVSFLICRVRFKTIARNIVKQAWFVGSVVFFFQHKNRDNSSSSECISFLALVEVMKEHTVSEYDKNIPVVKMNKSKKQQLLENPNCTLIDPKYAVISINDIVRQVGLVQSITSSVYHSVISPYFVFNNNLAETAGNIVNL